MVVLLVILLLQLVILGSLIWSQVSWVWRLTDEQLEIEIAKRGW